MRRVITAANPGNATAPRGKLSSHAPAIQVDMDDPNIDWGDPLVIDVLGRYWTLLPWNGGLLGDTLIAPIENVDSGGGGAIGAGGGGGGTSICETRQQCISRRTQLAEQRRTSCRWDAVGLFLMVAGVSIGGAALIALVTGPETVGVGALVALIGGGIGVTVAVINFAGDLNQCNSAAESYIQNSLDICSTKPETCP